MGMTFNIVVPILSNKIVLTIVHILGKILVINTRMKMRTMFLTILNFYNLMVMCHFTQRIVL